MAYDTMTVRQLKDMIKDLPDEAEIFLDDGASGFIAEMPNTTIKMETVTGHGQPVAVLTTNLGEASSPFERSDNQLKLIDDLEDEE